MVGAPGDPPATEEDDRVVALLGSQRSWPRPLRSALPLCLGLRTPAAILWGDDALVLCNDAYREAFALVEPTFGRPAREVWLRDWDELAPVVADVRRTGAAVWIDGPAGERADLRCGVSIAPLLDETGAVPGVLASWARLDPARDPALATGDFAIGAIAHELRNPLGTIANLVEVLRGEGGERGDALGAIDRVVDYMADLVQDLFEEGCRGAAELRAAPVRVADVVHDAIAAASGPILSIRCKVDVRIDDPELLVVADRRRLVRALANIIANTARLAKPDCTIEVFAARTPTEVEIGVHHRGLEAARIRSMTFEDATPESAGGLGLGFWLARRVVLAHGGCFRVVSDGNGAGSTVSLCFRGDGPPRRATNGVQPIFRPES